MTYLRNETTVGIQPGIETRLGMLYKNKDSKSVLDQFLPMLKTFPDRDLWMGETLITLGAFFPDMFPADLLKLVDIKLESLSLIKAPFGEIVPPLPREEVIKAIEGKNPLRIPLVMANWWGEGLFAQYGERLFELERFPEDVAMLWCVPIAPQKMGLSWEVKETKALDSHAVIDDWAKLDEFIDKLPNPENDPVFDLLIYLAEKFRKQNRYVLFSWWMLFFEFPWYLRGMTQLLLDFHLHEAEIHKLYDALCTTYEYYLQRAIRDLKPDGFWTSDDLGHQTQLFMNPETFRSLIKPYYKRIGDVVGQAGVHWWLHSCGNNTSILNDLAEVGVDVFHPVQKHAMDQKAVARDFGDKLSFLVGIDVQQALMVLDPDEVRQKVRDLIDAFDRPEGKMCIAAGNGIVGGTPYENIEAFLDEAIRYGTTHRQKFS